MNAIQISRRFCSWLASLTVVVAVAPLFSFCWLASLATAAELPGDTGTIVEYRVEKRGFWLELPVSMGSSNYPFTLDTGATVFMFDDQALPGRLTLMNEIMGVRTPGGDMPMKVAESAPMRLGPFWLGVQRGVLVSGLSDKLNAEGANSRGYMGMTALKDKVFTVDFDEGVVRFSKHVSRDAGTPIPLRWDHGVPFAVAEVEGLGKELFQIDTGACSFAAGSLRNEAFLKLALNRQLHMVGSPMLTVQTAAGRKRVSKGQVAFFSLGPFTHRGLIFDNNPAMSKLGLGYLSRYAVTFDMPGSTMYLQPGKEFDRLDRYDLSGVGIKQRNLGVPVPGINQRNYTDMIVSYVMPGGRGEAAGLQYGDVIVSVDGHSANETSVFEIYRLFSTPGDHRVVYERILDRYETKLTLGVEKEESKESEAVTDERAKRGKLRGLELIPVR